MGADEVGVPLFTRRKNRRFAYVFGEKSLKKLPRPRSHPVRAPYQETNPGLVPGKKIFLGRRLVFVLGGNGLQERQPPFHTRYERPSGNAGPPFAPGTNGPQERRTPFRTRCERPPGTPDPLSRPVRTPLREAGTPFAPGANGLFSRNLNFFCQTHKQIGDFFV